MNQLTKILAVAESVLLIITSSCKKDLTDNRQHLQSAHLGQHDADTINQSHQALIFLMNLQHVVLSLRDYC